MILDTHISPSLQTGRPLTWGVAYYLFAAAIAVLGATSPLGAQSVRGAAGDSAAAPTGPRLDWTGNRRTFAVGDIIRVAVDEYALASANKGTLASSSRRRRMGLGVEPPSLGAAPSPIGPVDASIETGDAGETRQRGEATRGSRYIGEIPVRVVAITPEGLLEVKGTKVIDVDKNRQEMTLTGFVRAQDVDARDVIESTAIADAQLSYRSKGGLGKPQNGILTRIVGLLWP